MLPHHQDNVVMTDGGLETWLVFGEGVTLRDFAAFELLETAEGRSRLEAYFRRHAGIAAASGASFLFDAPTWRASAVWGERLGYDRADLARVNRAAAEMARRLRDEARARHGLEGWANGVVGPHDDVYAPQAAISPEAAEAYHLAQLEALAEGGAEIATAQTLTHAEEAIGIVRAAEAAGLPIAVSFTVETDGLLPSGEPLGEAIARVDRATRDGAAYFMINCAHPDHFSDILADGGAWRDRLRGVRANASRLSHAELDAADELDDGDPVELGAAYRALKALVPRLTVLGGCCGTDHRHIEAIARTCARA